MKYNIYIDETGETVKYFFNVEESKVLDLTEAYKKRVEKIMIPTLGTINLINLENIAIYENESGVPSEALEDEFVTTFHDWFDSPDPSTLDKSPFTSLSNYGRDVSSVFLNSITKSSNYDWGRIHSIIHVIARPRFDSKQYADAVEASFKEINEIIKTEFKVITGKEEDGDKLMKVAFSPNQPIFKLADLSTENGKNIQLGYMEIFAGGMKGIRNPKAHKNLIVDPDEAWEMIILASHLMRMWDKRKKYENI